MRKRLHYVSILRLLDCVLGGFWGRMTCSVNLHLVHCLSNQQALRSKGNVPTPMTIGVKVRGKFAKILNYPFSKSPLSVVKVIFSFKKNNKKTPTKFNILVQWKIEKRMNFTKGKMLNQCHNQTANIILKESVSYLRNRRDQLASLGWPGISIGMEITGLSIESNNVPTFWAHKRPPLLSRGREEKLHH